MDAPGPAPQHERRAAVGQLRLPPAPVRARLVRRGLGQVDLLLYDMNAYAEENSRFPLDVELEFAGGGGI